MNSINNKSSETVEGNAAGSIDDSDPRIQLAIERTLLAWLRTGLALMAFGFVVARFALILQTLGLKTEPWLNTKATIIGVVLVLLGIVVNVAAPLHYRPYFRRLAAHGRPIFTAWSLTFVIALSISAIGITLAVYLLLVDGTLGSFTTPKQM